MNNEKMFEVAIRNKMRFPFKGLISVEDLWDLSVENLDKVFKTLNAEVKQVKEESLLDCKTKEDEELDLKIEIIKYIVDIKLQEYKSKLEEKERKDKKQKLMAILQNKQEEDLQNKSIDEIKAMINELN